jgi:hypothetical protein
MVNRPPLWYFLLSTVTATNALASCYDIKWLLDSISIIVFRVDFIQSNQNQIIATCRFHSSHYSRSQKLSPFQPQGSAFTPRMDPNRDVPVTATAPAAPLHPLPAYIHPESDSIRGTGSSCRSRSAAQRCVRADDSNEQRGLRRKPKRFAVRLLPSLPSTVM